MNKLSYLLLRLALGMSMFGHGFVRIPKLQAFSEWMMADFETSFLPDFVVIPFSYTLPFLEFFIGLFILFGLYTRQTLLAGGFVMIMLIFGTSMIENWGALPSQLIHVAFFAILLHFVDSNSFCLDTYIRNKPGS